MSRKLSPLRTMLGITRVQNVPMDVLDCGHLLTHDGEADRQTRRRCSKCRAGVDRDLTAGQVNTWRPNTEGAKR